MKTINIPDTKTLSYDERAELLFEVLKTLYSVWEFQRIDDGYSITIELQDEELPLRERHKFSYDDFVNCLFEDGMTIEELQKYEQFVNDFYTGTTNGTLDDLVYEFQVWLEDSKDFHNQKD